MSEYEARLDTELLTTLRGQRVAALGTLQPDGTPYVSMVPYAIEGASGRIVLQVAGLAPHAQHMRDDPRISLLVIALPSAGLAAAALPRLTLLGQAEFLAVGSDGWQACRAAFIERDPANGPINAMLEYDFVAVRLSAGRQVSGFGTARSLAGDTLQPLLTAA